MFCSRGPKMTMFSREFRFSDEQDILPFVEPSEFRAVSRAVDAAIATPVLALNRIVGRPDSLRARIPGGTLIVTRRDVPHELKREAHMLHKLWKVGAPVPRFVAISDDFLIEEDLGGRCLTSLLATVDNVRRAHLMEAAFAGLYQIKSVARRARFRKPPPVFQSNPDWLNLFVSSPLLLSDFLEIEPPPLSYSAVLKALEARTARFVKWGASPCSAHVCEEGSVSWFDWRTAGLGAGYEDIGFLISDENWPLDATASLALFRRFQWDWTPQAEDHLCIFATLRTCHRLLAVCHENVEETSMYAIPRLVAHGLALSRHSALMRLAEPWFERLTCEEVWREKLSVQPGIFDVRSSG